MRCPSRPLYGRNGGVIEDTYNVHLVRIVKYEPVKPEMAAASGPGNPGLGNPQEMLYV